MILEPLARTATLIISKEETEDIMKIVKSFEDSSLLLKGLSETIQNQAKEQKGGFLSMLLGTLGATFLGNMLAGKGINRAGYRIIWADYRSKRSLKNKKKLILLQLLSNLEVQKYYQNEPRFNGAYSRDNLPC